MRTNVRNIGLIGLGHHARRIYYPFLEKYFAILQLNLVIIVELQDHQDSVNAFLANRLIQPLEKFFISRDSAYSDTLTKSLLQYLDDVLERYRIDGIIVASDSKSHKAYVQWALSKNIDILLDKPVTCPLDAANTITAAKQIELDFYELNELYTRSNSNFIIQTQRRSHLGYVYIYKYLKEFIEEFQLPISCIEISHSDGMWVMPNEWERESHSYKYGTGKLMHSGYHFIDLWAWFLQLNQGMQEQDTELDIFVRTFNPSDFMNQLLVHHYAQLFQKDYSEDFSEKRVQQLKSYGELDVFVLSQLKRSQSTVTTTTLSLQQNSFSRRAWSKSPLDTYKGNGRIRHERFNIQVSTLLNIQVHSYQSYQINDPVVMDYGVGHIDHFDIFIFRNSQLTGGKSFEKLEIGKDLTKIADISESCLSHNEKAREELFLDFLNCTRSKSDFSCHAFTHRLLSKVYECIALERNEQMPYISFHLN